MRNRWGLGGLGGPTRSLYLTLTPLCLEAEALLYVCVFVCLFGGESSCVTFNGVCVCVHVDLDEYTMRL